MRQEREKPILGLPEEFSDLILAHYAGVYRMGLSILRNAHDAEEVCQEAFLKAYENYESYDPSRPFKTWVYTIAYRLLLNRMRDKRAAKKALEEAAPRPAAPIGIPDRAELAEMSERLDAVIHELDPEDQLLLHYRFRDDLKFSEIAQITHGSENAVRVRFFRLLGRLRSDFQGAK
jgi:RNA polymerase sigma-70 factor (ECF subfamily)